MLPDRGLQSLNSLIRFLAEFRYKRKDLHSLHQQRARATYARLNDGSPERFMAEGMCQSFFYQFDAADRTADLILDRTPLDSTYVSNLQKLLRDTFRYHDFLKVVGHYSYVFKDDVKYLTSTRSELIHNGFFEAADQITQLLTRGGNQPRDSQYSQGMLSAVQAYGLTDDSIASFLECGLKPLRELLNGKPTISYVMVTENVVEDPPELLAFTVYLTATFDQLMQVSEGSLNAISDETFDDAMDRRLVLTFNELSFDLEEPDAAHAVS